MSDDWWDEDEDGEDEDDDGIRLDPCPECGLLPLDVPARDGFYRVHCACGRTGPRHRFKPVAMVRWNQECRGETS